MKMYRLTAMAVAILVQTTNASASSCQIAEILFGDIKLDIISYDTYENVIVRHNNFDNQEVNSEQSRAKLR